MITTNTPIVQNTAVRVPPFFSRAGLQVIGTFRPDFPDTYTTQRHLLEGQAAIEGIQYDPDQPRMYKLSLNLQREVWRRTTVEVGYTGAACTCSVRSSRTAAKR